MHGHHRMPAPLRLGLVVMKPECCILAHRSTSFDCGNHPGSLLRKLNARLGLGGKFSGGNIGPSLTCIQLPTRSTSRHGYILAFKRPPEQAAKDRARLAVHGTERSVLLAGGVKPAAMLVECHTVTS
jgi:hypothetical protein